MDIDAFLEIPETINNMFVEQIAVGVITDGTMSKGGCEILQASEHLGTHATPPLVVQNVSMTTFREGYDSDNYQESFHKAYDRLCDLSYKKYVLSGAVLNNSERGVPYVAEIDATTENSAIRLENALAAALLATFIYAGFGGHVLLLS